MKCAIVHDWMVSMRGGEKLLDAFCRILPACDIYTLIWARGRLTSRIERHPIFTSWMDRLPGVTHYYHWLLPLMPSAMKRLRLRDYDLVLSISHCIANGITVEGNAKRICYCNTPMRYAWGTRESYFASGRRGARYWALRAVTGWLRRWDQAMSRRVQAYISNSHNVQRRVKECYGRDSTVIYPPVDTAFFRPTGDPPSGDYLWVGAPAPYKRLDLALEAFRQVGSRLIVIGDHPDLSRMRRRAPANVSFLGRLPDGELRRHYSSCRALVFPGEEDFGIVPLEVQACGRPVIAFARGGALETVLGAGSSGDQQPTGVFFHEPTAASLRAAIEHFEGISHIFDPETIRDHALHFGYDRFDRNVRSYLERFLGPEYVA